MSLPSVAKVAEELGIDFSRPTTPEQQEHVLWEAMQRDLEPALKFLHQKAHDADKNGGSAEWEEDPSSPMGKMLIRIHAGDVLRELVSRRKCHGKQLTFVNCCRGWVGTPPTDLMLIQIRNQNGDLASPDC